MTNKTLLLAGLLPALLVLGGCQGSSYDAARACSIPTDTVAAVLGTDRFTTSQERIEDLPFTDTSTTGSAACHVTAGDLKLSARVLVVPQQEAARHAATIGDDADSFPLAGGIARADDKQGAWLCGSVWVTVWLDGDLEADPQDMRAAVESVAEAAGCHTSTA